MIFFNPQKFTTSASGHKLRQQYKICKEKIYCVCNKLIRNIQNNNIKYVKKKIYCACNKLM